MQQTHQERSDFRGGSRPRGQYGRFESDPENRSQYRGYEDYQNEAERPGDGGSRGYSNYQDQPRDEYGRFESTTSSGRYYGASPQSLSSQYERQYDRQSERQYDRPRDEHGRFESNTDSRWMGNQGRQDWPRDDYGRFESGGSGRDYRSANDRPRDEYGRFESGSSQRHQNGDSMTSWAGTGQRGQHAGKGPKGYQRSDERIQEDVNEALAQDSNLDAGEIEVKVNGGVVTLSGNVSDRQYKRMAEDLAERCSGVKDVRNEIRVGRDSETSTAEKGKSHTTGTAKSA
jgi:hypothetical protein